MRRTNTLRALLSGLGCCATAGVSDTGSAGTIITGADGTLATDVRKSEPANADLDDNGKQAEVLEALVVAIDTGVLMADAFDTRTRRGGRK
jgi:hypothetical protein